MPKSIIEQELEGYLFKFFSGAIIRDKKGKFYEKADVIFAIQRVLKEAEKRINNEFKENENATGCKITAKQILNDCFGVGK